MSAANLLADAQALLYREADFLDQANLDDWVDLYTPDGVYWMPVTPEQTDPINHISLFYDDRTIMEIRRRNLSHPRAASKDLPIRCSHLIGNICLGEGASAKAMTVMSNFHCVVFSDNKQQLYAGTYQHELVIHNADWRIKQKRVNIINCDANLSSMLIYI